MARHILDFEVHALWQSAPERIEQTARTSSHALGNIAASENRAVIRDAYTDWAMEFLFHDFIETFAYVPTWDDFRDYIVSSRPVDWYRPMRVIGLSQGLRGEVLDRALQWRLGNAWMSSLRVAHLLVSLRHVYNIPVKYHPLVDVLLRVDGWHGNHLIDLRVPNLMELRKSDPRLVFAEHGFSFHQSDVRRQGYGHVWLASKSYIEDLAYFLRDEDQGSAPLRRGPRKPGGPEQLTLGLHDRKLWQ